MDYNLANKRGLNPKKVAKMRAEDIGFFTSFEEFDEILRDHEWERTDFNVLGLTYYTLTGCQAEISVRNRSVVTLKSLNAKGEIFAEATAPLTECMMMGGSLIVGAGVEI